MGGDLENDATACLGFRGSIERLPFDLTALRYILAASEFKSFHSTAEALGTYPATVSRSVRKVEDAIGVSLFERGAGGVRLTEAGRQFACLVAAALSQLRKATQIAEAAGRAEIGAVHVGVMTSLAGGFLRHLIADFKARHPGVAIEVHDGSRRDHLAHVRERLLDAAFIVGTDEVPEFATTALWRERLYVALAKGHKLAHRQSLDWSELTQERFIATQIDPGPHIRDHIQHRLADHGVEASVDLKPVRQETLMHMVGLGEGVTVVSEARVAMSFPDVTLRPLINDADMLSLSMVWSPRNDNPALRRLISRAHILAASSGHVLRTDRS
jgi:DNA-binding transcriptional LysR family regulator